MFRERLSVREGLGISLIAQRRLAIGDIKYDQAAKMVLLRR
jgi:hypothetical protein